jgi:23S rRNA (cytosine1962-C5)-methyltransferase
MSARKSRPARTHDDERRPSPNATPELTAARSLDLPLSGSLPKVTLRSVRRHPLLFRKLIGRVDEAARPGDVVAVQTPQGELLGYGLYNPRAEMTVRMLSFGDSLPDAAFWRNSLVRAVGLRRDLLQLDSVTDAYRVVHAEADGLSGLVVDRYGDVLSAEVFSLAMWQRAEALLAPLSEILGTRHTLVQIAPQTHGQEGFFAEPMRSMALPRDVVISEFGTKFRVRFEEGHKTGFFCDQRENRRQLASFCRGRTVLDLCSYTGGFAIQAATLGQAREVTGVDLDEQAIALARENARLNQAKVGFVHADVFGYMRDMLANGRTYDVIVLDPPKLIRNRREIDEGTRKHFDLNRLALKLVAPGGLLVTCTCSGLLTEEEFLRLIHLGARQAGDAGESGRLSRPAGRSLQILAKTGAAPDHPVSPDCPETEYLKAAWVRVL